MLLEIFKFKMTDSWRTLSMFLHGFAVGGNLACFFSFGFLLGAQSIWLLKQCVSLA
jgi:hypothetical protein